jgi:large subunit ribosomal protein L13
MKMKTTTKKLETKTVDANGRTLGRVASEAAMHLMGKTSPSFERNVYSGFPVQVVNVSKIKITNKYLFKD